MSDGCQGCLRAQSKTCCLGRDAERVWCQGRRGARMQTGLKPARNPHMLSLPSVCSPSQALALPPKRGSQARALPLKRVLSVSSVCSPSQARAIPPKRVLSLPSTCPKRVLSRAHCLADSRMWVRVPSPQAFMSTTLQQNVAMGYAKGHGSRSGIVIKVRQGMVNRGADISWLSQVRAFTCVSAW